MYLLFEAIQVEAIQMSANNIYFYKESQKNIVKCH